MKMIGILIVRAGFGTVTNSFEEDSLNLVGFLYLNGSPHPSQKVRSREEEEKKKLNLSLGGFCGLGRPQSENERKRKENWQILRSC